METPTNTRLPQTPKTTDHGTVYVVQRGEAYKIGFTRDRLKRRVRASDGVLVLTVATGQHPAALERLIHQRFAAKRTTGPGFKREWFTLDAADLAWLRGLSLFMDTEQGHHCDDQGEQ